MSNAVQAIVVDNLTKEYKNGVKALDHLSLTVEQGEIFTLLGPNGAGKSTLINTLTTYLTPTSGTVTMMGKDLCREPDFIRSQIACVSQQISIDTHLSNYSNMRFIKSIAGWYSWRYGLRKPGGFLSLYCRSYGHARTRRYV